MGDSKLNAGGSQ